MTISNCINTDQITAQKYNEIKSVVNLVLGVGDGGYGYGQSISAITEKNSNDIMSHLEWVDLHTDITKCIIHQGDITTGFTVPTATDDLSTTLVNKFIDYANQLDLNKINIGNTEQTSTILQSSVRTTDWNNTIVNECKVTAVTADDLRYFFNAGGKVVISASLTSFPLTSKNADWHNMLDSMGDVTFGYNSTVALAGNNSNIGWHNLDIANTEYEIFSISGTVFSNNKYSITASTNLDISELTFKISFSDNDTSTGDGNVSGTTTSTISQIFASGSNVAVSPLAIGYNDFTGGDMVSTYAVMANSYAIKQGDPVTITFSASQLPVGSVLTWEIPTDASINNDTFVDGLLTGSLSLTDGQVSITTTAATLFTTASSKSFIVKFLNNGFEVARSASIKISTTPKQTYINGIAGTGYSWTVPVTVTLIRVNLVGGGGGGYGWHDGDYGTYATPGGPGGGVKNLLLSVTAGDICTYDLGTGGGSGYYNGGTGRAGTDSVFRLNGTVVCTAYHGNTAVSRTAGTPGSGVIVTGTGTVVSGTAGSEVSANDTGYSVWNFGSTGVAHAGKQSITPPAGIPNYTRAGLTEYPGWVSIEW